MPHKSHASLACFFILFLLASYAHASDGQKGPNGLVKIVAEPIDEGQPLDVFIYCKQQDSNVVTVAIYGPDDRPVYPPVTFSCNQLVVTFTNLRAGVYKVKATMGANFEPNMMFTYVNVRPHVFSIFSIPEQPQLFVPFIALFVLFLLRRERQKVN